MDDSELERTPNPFSAFAESRVHSRRNLASTAKFLICSIALFCVVTVGQVYFQRARLAEIVNSFSGSTTAEKVEHLQQLQASGVTGIDGIVAAIADEQPEVSALAVNLLSEMNHQWMTLPTEQLSERRCVFADSLVKVSKQIGDKTDPRWASVQSLARRAAQDLIDSADAVNEQTYETLMRIIASDSGEPFDPPQRDIAVAKPLPIDLVDHAAAGWTDWPPTSTTPALYRRSVATLNSDPHSTAILRQTDGNDTSADAEARLVKPAFRPAATLADQAQRGKRGDMQSTPYWITQLESASRLVRMRAVTELGTRGDEQAISALRSHLKTESDHTVAIRIRQRLEM